MKYISWLLASFSFLGAQTIICTVKISKGTPNN